MRHRLKGRKLGRNGSHRKAMFRNMAVSLINSLRVDEDEPNAPKVSGRIITTVAKAKELRPFIEKLITMAKRSLEHEAAAQQYATTEEPNSDGYKKWRESEQWQKWVNAKSPAIALRRRAFAQLRDKQAVSILFEDLAPRFEYRPGGYTRIVKLAQVRLGDAGEQALIEFVGENDRVQQKRTAPVVKDEESSAPQSAPAPVAEAQEESPADESSEEKSE